MRHPFSLSVGEGRISGAGPSLSKRLYRPISGLIAGEGLQRKNPTFPTTAADPAFVAPLISAGSTTGGRFGSRGGRRPPWG